MKQKLSIPRDLREYATSQFLKRVIPCALMTGAPAIVLYLWGNVIFPTDSRAFKAIAYTLVLFIPFYVCGVPFKVVDGTWGGKILHCDIKTSAVAEKVGRRMYYKNTVYLTIETPSGEFDYRKVYEGNAFFRKELEKYREGDYVFHLYGSKHVVYYEGKAEEVVQCAVCGDKNDSRERVCRLCRHSLVKRDDIAFQSTKTIAKSTEK